MAALTSHVELLSRLSLRYTGEHSVLKVEEHGLLGKKVKGEWLRQHSPLEFRQCQQEPQVVAMVLLTCFGRLFTAALLFLSFGTGVFISCCFILEVGILILQWSESQNRLSFQKTLTFEQCNNCETLRLSEVRTRFVLHHG